MGQHGRMTARRLVVVTAGVAEPSSSRRLADRLAAAAVTALAARGVDAAVRTIEVRDVAADVVRATLEGVRTESLEDVLAAVTDADAIVAVSPVFNGSYSGLFKSLFDLLRPGDLEGRPVLAAATGGSERHALVVDHALRPLLTTLHGVVLPTGVFAASGDRDADALDARILRAAEELATAVVALPARTRADRLDDVFTDTDFEDLLRALD